MAERAAADLVITGCTALGHRRTRGTTFEEQATQPARPLNLGWHPTAEDYLWTPQNQEAKVSQGGGHNVRYRTGYEGRMVRAFLELLEGRLPYCRVRYAF